MTLIKKQRKHKGGGLLAREGTQQSGQLPAPQAVPAAQKRHIEKPAIAPKRSPEKLSVRSQMQVQPPTQPQPQPSRAPFPAAVPVPTQTPAAVSARAPDKPEAGRSTAQKMLPVEVDGRTLQLDIGALNSVQEVVRAVKELHSTLAWSAVRLKNSHDVAGPLILPLQTLDEWSDTRKVVLCRIRCSYTQEKRMRKCSIAYTLATILLGGTS